MSLGFGDHEHAQDHGRLSLFISQSLMEETDEPLMRPLKPPVIEDISDELQGSSSFSQSVFNAVNVLIGVGILSLPFAFKIAGWALGFALLVGFMCITNYTARIIALCLDYQPPRPTKIYDLNDRMSMSSFDSSTTARDAGNSSRSGADNFSHNETLHRNLMRSQIMSHISNSPGASPKKSSILGLPERLMSYADIGEAAFGFRGKIFISIVFTLELFAAGIALVILIADSFHTLYPALGIVFFKFVAFFLVTPSLWLKKLNWLSYFSLLGIFTIVCLVVVILIDGLSVRVGPGSLWDLADTSIIAPSFSRIPMSFGLIMAGFAGHAVFPNIYREMRNPHHFPAVVNTSYVFTFMIYGCMASLGYMMFGSDTLDEITKNLALVPGYNRALNIMVIWLVIINPMTKYALTLQPMCTSIEMWFLRQTRQWTHPGITRDPDTHYPIVMTWGRQQILIKYDTFRIFLRTFISMLVLITSVLFPGFERIIGLLGSLFSVIVSIMFPVACYLKLYGSQLSQFEKWFNWGLLGFAGFIAFTGTLWAFLPGSWVGVNSRILNL